MSGYNYYKTINVIDEFLNSESNDFELYLKEKIQNWFLTILLFIYDGNNDRINNNLEFITFENSKQINEIVIKMEKLIN